MNRVVMFSSGAASAIAAERVLKQYSATLLFTDTRFEDADNYRFANEVYQYFLKQGYEADLEMVKDGRTPLELFKDEGILGNDRVPVCSRKLKGDQTIKWLKKQGRPLTLYFGFDFKELHRAKRVTERYAKLDVGCEYPLCKPPYSPPDKQLYIRQEWGIEPPRMYRLGFKHANCGGRCVRGKVNHWRQLLRVWPDRYKEMEEFEGQFKGGKYTFLPGVSLTELRESCESQLDMFKLVDSPEHAPCIQCL